MEWVAAGSIRSLGGPGSTGGPGWGPGWGRFPSRRRPHPRDLVEGSRLGPCPSYT